MHDVWETIAVVLQLQNENPAVDIHEAVANVPFSSFLLLSCVRLCDPRDCRMPSFRVHPNSRSLFELMSIVSVMPSNHLILCCPLLPPSVFPSNRGFSNNWAIHISWPKYWSFSISPSSEYSGWTALISLLSKVFSRAFSNTTVQKCQFFGSQLSL